MLSPHKTLERGEAKIVGYRDFIMMTPHYENWFEVNSHEKWFLYDVKGNRVISKIIPSISRILETRWRSLYAELFKAKLAEYAMVDGMLPDDAGR